jgi:CDP-6-deoxy-D-xylo-4-hexulose-3-dehydrase
MSNYPLATSTWDDEELKAIQSVIDSNKFTMGDHVRSFENNFGNFINRKYLLW